MQNKKLLLGAAVALVLWLMVYFAFVRSNWSAYAAKLKEADTANAEWEKYYQTKPGLLSRKEAEKALEENGNLLSANLQTLQKIELGIPQWLYAFTIPAAKGDDPNNYFDRKRKEIVARANDVQRIPVPNALGFGDRAGEDPVSVKLMRLFMVDTVINACAKAGVTRIAVIKHYSPRMIFADADENNPAEEEGAAPAPPAKKGAAAKTHAPVGASRIVQFPVKVSIQAPEKSIGRLLFELQQPSDKDHGYLCVHGFSVSAKDTGSGLVDATVAMSGLLNENYVKEVGIAIKGEEDRPGAGRKVDLKGW